MVLVVSGSGGLVSGHSIWFWVISNGFRSFRNKTCLRSLLLKGVIATQLSRAKADFLPYNTLNIFTILSLIFIKL